MDLRIILRAVSDEEFSLASRAVQMLEWQKNHQVLWFLWRACRAPTQSMPCAVSPAILISIRVSLPV